MVADGAVQGGPGGVLAATEEGPAAADSVAAVDGDGPTSGASHGGGDQVEVGIHRAANRFVEEGGEVAAVGPNHHAPADRAVGDRELLDDPDLGDQVDFRTA